MSLTAKVRRYRRLQSTLATLEREIKAEATPVYRGEGCLVNPRIERILERFA